MSTVKFPGWTSWTNPGDSHARKITSQDLPNTFCKNSTLFAPVSYWVCHSTRRKQIHLNKGHPTATISCTHLLSTVVLVAIFHMPTWSLTLRCVLDDSFRSHHGKPQNQHPFWSTQIPAKLACSSQFNCINFWFRYQFPPLAAATKTPRTAAAGASVAPPDGAWPGVVANITSYPGFQMVSHMVSPKSNH